MGSRAVLSFKKSRSLGAVHQRSIRFIYAICRNPVLQLQGVFHSEFRREFFPSEILVDFLEQRYIQERLYDRLFCVMRIGGGENLMCKRRRHVYRPNLGNKTEQRSCADLCEISAIVRSLVSEVRGHLIRCGLTAALDMEQARYFDARSEFVARESRTARRSFRRYSGRKFIYGHGGILPLLKSRIGLYVKLVVPEHIFATPLLFYAQATVSHMIYGR